MSQTKETVLIVGATGNIGLSAVHGALQAGLHVLAIVRNEKSAKKIFDYIGSQDHITTVEANVLADDGVQGVVDKVKKGELPAFQHVYACVGGDYSELPLQAITTEHLRTAMNLNFEGNFFAYRATIPYLLSQNSPNSSWTICTGSQGETGERAMPAMTQGALFSLSRSASVALASSNVRFNEIYLAHRVEEDASAEAHGVTKSSSFGQVYTKLLVQRKDVKGARVVVSGPGDLETLQVQK